MAKVCIVCKKKRAPGPSDVTMECARDGLQNTETRCAVCSAAPKTYGVSSGEDIATNAGGVHDTIPFHHPFE